MSLRVDYEAIRGQFLNRTLPLSLDIFVNEFIQEKACLQTLHVQNNLMFGSDTFETSSLHRESSWEYNKIFCNCSKCHGQTIETFYRYKKSIALTVAVSNIEHAQPMTPIIIES